MHVSVVSHRLIQVVVGCVVFGYLVRCGLPHAFMGHDVAKNFIQLPDPVGLFDDVGVKRNTNDPCGLRTFPIKLIELGLAYASEVHPPQSCS